MAGRQTLLLLVVETLAAWAAGAVVCEPRITGVIDGPFPEGAPRAVELFFPCRVSEASAYSVEAPSEGSGLSVVALTGCISARAFAYVAFGGGAAAHAFADWFGFAPTIAGDAKISAGVIRLLSGGAVVDTFGSTPAAPGASGLPWNFTSSWAYRRSSSGPSSAFDAAEWRHSGSGALAGARDQASAGSSKFPVGSYSSSADVGVGASECPATAETPTAGDDEEIPIVYIVVMVVLSLAICIAGYTIVTVCGQKLKRKIYGGPPDGSKRLRGRSTHSSGSMYGKQSEIVGAVGQEVRV